MRTGTTLCLILLQVLVTSSFDELYFLKEYGYLPSSSNAQYGSDVLGNALRTLQKAYGLEQTGELDARTKAAMREPRCGAKDVVTTRTRSKRWQEPKWDKRHLTYGVSVWSKHLSASRVEQLLMKATAAWTEAADFTFSRAHHPDIPIRFGERKHNCSYAFEPSVLAHTFPPTDGSMHFNDMHVWKDTEVSDARGISFYSVAVHELGHALGLKHNMDEPNSIMSPRELFRKGEITERDKYMLKRLYGTLRKEDKNPHPADPATTPRSLPPPRPPTTGPPDICKCSVDAIGNFRGEFIVFKDDWLWRMPHEGKRILRPEKISSLLPQVPSPVDAAVEIEGDLWLFSGQKVYLINVGVGGFQLKHSPLSFTQIGLPSELKRIRLAYKWHYFDPPAVYLWGENEYWRMNVAERKMEATYPRPIERNWKYVPSDAVAAFNKERELHFLTDSRVYRMNTTDYRLSVAAGYPINQTQFWQGCETTESTPPPTRYSRSSSGGSLNDMFWGTVLVLLLIFS